MRLSALLLLASLLVDDLTTSTDGPGEVLPADAVIVVVYTGQSNTYGTNSFVTDTGYSPPYDPDYLEGCYIWDQIKRGTHLSMSMTDPDRGGERHRFRALHRGYGRSSPSYPWEDMPSALSLGAELQLAHRLWREYQRPVYIVKCAKGNVPLYQVPDRRAGYPYPEPPLPALPSTFFNWDWNRASDVDAGGGTGVPGQYSMFKLWRDYYWRGALMELLERVDGDRSRIYFAGVVHLQGAADSGPAAQQGQWAPGRAAADAFAANLALLVDGFRDVLSPGEPDRVPLVLGRSEHYYDDRGNTLPGHKYIGEVRHAQELVQAATRNSVLFSTDEVPIVDGEHFDGAGQQLLGDLIFEALTRVKWMRGPRGE
jgi:hypothetical protein